MKPISKIVGMVAAALIVALMLAITIGGMVLLAKVIWAAIL